MDCRRWIDQFWKFIQNVRHFIFHVPHNQHANYDVYIGKLGHPGVAPLFSQLRKDQRNSCSSTLSHWEESIDDPLTDNQRLYWNQFLCKGTASTNRPFCIKVPVKRLPSACSISKTGSFYRVRTCCDLGHTSTHTKGYHDAVLHHIGLPERSQRCLSDHLCPFSHAWLEGPFGCPDLDLELCPRNQKVTGSHLEAFQGVGIASNI